MPVAGVLVAALVTSAGPAQVVGSRAGGGGVGYAAWYGDPEEVALEELAANPRGKEGRAVRTRGLLLVGRDGTWRLQDGTSELLLLPARELDATDLQRLRGLQVEAVGAPRELPEHQGTCLHEGQVVPESVCRDWLLPALPDRQGHGDWPRVSLTAWSLSDATPLAEAPRARAAPARAGPGLREIAAAPESFLGQTVTVLAQYRGSNLFGDLPEVSRLAPTDWVVARDGAAAWVRGKPPRGSGWQLALDSKAEARWWIEVSGRVEVQDGVVYIRARQLGLKPAPPNSE